jgi:hypothetical protein
VRRTCLPANVRCSNPLDPGGAALSRAGGWRMTAPSTWYAAPNIQPGTSPARVRQTQPRTARQPTNHPDAARTDGFHSVRFLGGVGGRGAPAWALTPRAPAAPHIPRKTDANIAQEGHRAGRPRRDATAVAGWLWLPSSAACSQLRRARARTRARGQPGRPPKKPKPKPMPN